MYGNGLAVLSGITMALMIVCMRHQKDGRPAETIILGNLLSAVVGLPFVLQETMSWTSAGMIVYLGLFQMGLSFTLYSVAIRHLHALESTLIVTLEPILNPVWVFFVTGETPGPLTLTGGVLVLGAVTLRAVVSARGANGLPLKKDPGSRVQGDNRPATAAPGAGNGDT